MENGEYIAKPLWLAMGQEYNGKLSSVHIPSIHPSIHLGG
jgi:hypothetical protein